MQTIAAGVPTFVDQLQTLCLYKSSVGTACVATPSEALFGQYCTAGSSTPLCKLIDSNVKNDENENFNQNDHLFV